MYPSICFTVVINVIACFAGKKGHACNVPVLWPAEEGRNEGSEGNSKASEQPADEGESLGRLFRMLFPPFSSFLSFQEDFAQSIPIPTVYTQCSASHVMFVGSRS